MRRSTTAKLLLILVALLAGLGSAYQLSRYPSRLRAALGVRDYLGMDFSPDGKIVATLEKGDNSSNTIKLWDTMTGQEKTNLANKVGDIRQIWFSPDSRYLAANDVKLGLRLWNLVEGNERCLVPNRAGSRSRAWYLDFSPDSKLLAVEVSEGPKYIRLFDTNSGEQLANFEGHLTKVESVLGTELEPLGTFAIASDGQTIASANWISVAEGNVLRLWDVKTKQDRKTQTVNRERIVSMAFSPDGSMLALCSKNADGKVETELRDVSNLKESARFVPYDNCRNASLEFTPNGRLLVGRRALWDVRTKQPQKLMDLGVGRLEFTRDGSQMALVDDKNATVEFLHSDTLRSRLIIKPSDFSDLFNAWFSADGSLLLLSGRQEEKRDDGLIPWIAEQIGLRQKQETHYITQLWDPVTGKKLATFNASVIPAPDGAMLATMPSTHKAGVPHEIMLWVLPLQRPIE